MAHYVVDFFRNIYHRLSSISTIGLAGSADANDDGEITISKRSDTGKVTTELQMHCELQIRRCTSFDELHDVIPRCFYQLFPKVKYCHVYIGSDSLEDATGFMFPSEGLASELIFYKDIKQNMSLKLRDPLYELLKSYVEPKTLSTLGVSYLPILPPTDNDKPVGCLLFISEKLIIDAETSDIIYNLTTSISDTFINMQSQYYSSAFSLLSQLSKIDDNIAQAQLTVVQHLKDETGCDSGFLLAYNKYDDDFVLKAFDNKLVPEKRFPRHSLPAFSAKLSQTKPIVSSYTRELKRDIVSVGGRLPAEQCLIAPITQNGENIAFITLLSVSKNTFSREKLALVQAVLTLSGSMLYKDMIVERERTLRKQTEKLHQVAKNIFTHLGNYFGQLLNESYLRLIDLVAVPELPTPIQATHGCSHYKNIFIPPIGCQRLISLDDRLLIIGPRSVRHSNVPEAFQKRSIRDEGSDDTGLSSVINSYETGHVIVDMHDDSSNDQPEYSHQQSHSLSMVREKWEPAAPNLGYISEEAEASNVDTVLTNVSAQTTRDSSRGASVRNSVTRRSKRRSNPAAADKNNNADREEQTKKRGMGGSKLTLRSSRHVMPQSFGAIPPTAGTASTPAENDMLAQILGATADVPQTARPSRGSSVVGVNQRPSTFGMSGNMPGSKMNVNYGRGRGPSLMKVTSKKSVAKTAGSILDMSARAEQGRLYHLEHKKIFSNEPQRKSFSRQEKDNAGLPGEKSIEPRNMSDVSLCDQRFRSSLVPKTPPDIPLLPVQEGGMESRRPSMTGDIHQAKQSSVMTGESGSDFTGASTQGSKNDSLESVDLRNFQAALKKDLRLHQQQTGQADREKAMMMSIMEYRRRSILEESPSVAEPWAAQSSDDKIKAERSDSMDARLTTKAGKSSKISMSELRVSPDGGNQHSSFTLSRECPQEKKDGRSHEAVNVMPNVGKSFKQGSHISLMDMTAKVHKQSIVRKMEVVPYERKMEIVPYEGKSKKSYTTDQVAPLRRSVMNLDSRVKDVNDSRLAYADKIDRRSQMHRFSVSVVPTSQSNVNDLIMNAADATSGPFKKRASNMESSLRSRFSIMETKPFDPPSRLGVQRPSMAKSEDSIHRDALNRRKSSCNAYRSRGTQYDNSMLSTSAAQTSMVLTKYPSIDLETPTRLRDKRMSYDGPSPIQSFLGRHPQSQLEILAVKYGRSSSMDQHNLTMKKSLTSHHKPTSVEAPTESLRPLLAPISGTVLPTMTQITSARSQSNKPSVKSTSETSCHATDSDINTLLYNNISTYDGIRVEAGDYTKKKSRRLEVKCMDTNTSEFELFTWRWTTAKILKLTPVTHCVGIDENDLTNLLKEIMQEARNITNAEKCSVFLMESDVNELVAKVFDGDIASDEVRISATEGIAGHVVQTGKILNIKDAYSHPLFYRGVDQSTGFKTRSILCFPIKDERDNIIGAAQLCNKIGSPYFTSIDEDIAQALATYCCISIVHSLMYRDVVDAHNRVKLANELMVFHMHVPHQEVVDLMKQPVQPLSSYGDNLYLNDIKLSVPRYINTKDMPSAVVSMFHELDFVQTFRIKPHTLSRFILMVRKGYRDPPYHNWHHAFSVAHFAYLLLQNLNCLSTNILDELEALAYFVAALCHDIDHRGTSNSFQVASKSVLAALYSSEGSVMERHHFSQTMCILNTEGCNIFENVSRKEYEQLLDLIRDIILSTDIAHHLRIRAGLEGMALEGFDKTSGDHKSLLMCLFMTCADLSDQTKPWSAAKRVSKMLYKEFFSQGDLEKALGRNPMEMMDRERASIPNLQIGFIDHIVLPAFSTLKTIFVETEGLVANIENNRDHWMTIKSKAADKRGSITSLEVFDFIDAEDEKENGNSVAISAAAAAVNGSA